MVWALSIGVEETLFQQLLLSSPYLFDSIFQVQFGLISCINVLKEFVSVFNKKTEKKKNTVPLFMVMVAKRKKKSFIKNKNLVDSNYH